MVVRFFARIKEAAPRNIAAWLFQQVYVKRDDTAWLVPLYKLYGDGLHGLDDSLCTRHLGVSDPKEPFNLVSPYFYRAFEEEAPVGQGAAAAGASRVGHHVTTHRDLILQRLDELTAFLEHLTGEAKSRVVGVLLLFGEFITKAGLANIWGLVKRGDQEIKDAFKTFLSLIWVNDEIINWLDDDVIHYFITDASPALRRFFLDADGDMTRSYLSELEDRVYVGSSNSDVVGRKKLVAAQPFEGCDMQACVNYLMGELFKSVLGGTVDLCCLEQPALTCLDYMKPGLAVRYLTRVCDYLEQNLANAAGRRVKARLFCAFQPFLEALGGAVKSLLSIDEGWECDKKPEAALHALKDRFASIDVRALLGLPAAPTVATPDFSNAGVAAAAAAGSAASLLGGRRPAGRPVASAAAQVRRSTLRNS